MHSKGRSCLTTLAERRSAVDAALVVVEQLSVCFTAVNAAVISYNNNKSRASYLKNRMKFDRG